MQKSLIYAAQCVKQGKRMNRDNNIFKKQMPTFKKHKMYLKKSTKIKKEWYTISDYANLLRIMQLCHQNDPRR